MFPLLKKDTREEVDLPSLNNGLEHFEHVISTVNMKVNTILISNIN